MSWDVVVIGYGYAGAMAAIEARDAGASVLLLEKMAEPGGISICSAGGVRIAFDAEGALDYLEATNAGTTPTSVLRGLAEGMVEPPDRLRELARVNAARVEVRPAKGNYPFPGHESFGFAEVEDVPGFSSEVAYPNVRGSAAGARLFKVVEDNVRERGIEVRLETGARRLLTDGAHRVMGIDVDTGEPLHAGAVVLACGGFEADAEMQKQFWQGKPVLPAAFRGNTDDGIRMAQALGAGLWHMWHYHGSYGFQHPDPSYPFGIRTKRLPDWIPGDPPHDDLRMPWILLDRDGHRFMNEYEPYLQDTGHRPLERFRPDAQDYARLPAWLVADDAGRRLYPFGRPTYNERGQRFAWSDDNLAEVELGILQRAENLDGLAFGLSVSRARLEATLARWNRGCERRRDEDFGRPAPSMEPLSEPPFFFAPVWPIVSNTQGGPVHDERQRVLDAFGDPIAGLYACGERGSVFGHLYLSGGNLAECFVGGPIAGREAAGA